LPSKVLAQGSSLYCCVRGRDKVSPSTGFGTQSLLGREGRRTLYLKGGETHTARKETDAAYRGHGGRLGLYGRAEKKRREDNLG